MREHDDQVFEIPMMAMFCVAMRRSVFEQIGFLDERFGMGMFEDDDYTRRLRVAGYQICCARDSFVHNVGGASFRKLGTSDTLRCLSATAASSKRKWGEVWQPHRMDLKSADTGSDGAVTRNRQEGRQEGHRDDCFSPG